MSEYKLDFAKPEYTMQCISETGKNACDQLFQTQLNLAEAEVDLKAAVADTYLRAREQLIKPTEAMVGAAVDCDENIIRKRRAVAKLDAQKIALMKHFESIHGDRRMFTAWFLAQSRTGME